MNAKRNQTLTAREAAQRLEVSHAQVTRYVKKGLLPATRHGQMLVIRLADVERFQRPPRGNPNFLKKN